MYVHNKIMEVQSEKDGGRAEAILKSAFYMASTAALLLGFRHVVTCLTSYALMVNGVQAQDTWQYLWDKVIDVYGDDFFLHHVVGTTIVMNVLFFGVGGIYIYLDLTTTPNFLRKYKIQPGTNEPLPWTRFVALMYQIVWNQAVVGILFSLFTYQMHRWRFGFNDSSLNASVHTLPSFMYVVGELFVFVVIEEVMFFYSHWALHRSRLLYQNIHKRHHEWQATVAYAAIYAHPVEHILSNLLPPAVGPILCRSHVTTTWLWYALVITTTLNSHSGYHFPFMPSPEAHDFHHLRFNQCFGTLGLLDYLHGTDTLFRSNKAYQRHITLMSSKPARDLYPDD